MNERGFIVDCLDSLLAQDYGGIVEILVVDGGSSDGTRHVVERQRGLVRLLDNPGVSAAAAMNVGVASAAGDIICRADAHTLYARDYVRRCVEVLLETKADNVGGPMTAVGITTFGRAVAAVTSSTFGVGGAAFHGQAERADVDTVYLGCWWRDTLVDLDGYDDSGLQWAAEDHELNFRLRRAGGRIVLDPAIRSWYFPRQTPGGLARQYHNYGIGKASTLAKHGAVPVPTWRPLAPAGLVLATAVTALALRGWRRAAVPLAHGCACAVVALGLGRAPDVASHRAFAAVEICHWSYGIGFWRGMTRLIRRRPFESRPRARAHEAPTEHGSVAPLRPARRL